jgi:hypothetical protein
MCEENLLEFAQDYHLVHGRIDTAALRLYRDSESLWLAYVLHADESSFLLVEWQHTEIDRFAIYDSPELVLLRFCQWRQRRSIDIGRPASFILTFAGFDITEISLPKVLSCLVR